MAIGTFNDGQMDLAGIGYQVHTDALIKTHKPAAMGNGKRQEVAIGDLTGAQHPLPTDEALVQQADLLRPEDVAGVVAGFLKSFRHPWPRADGLHGHVAQPWSIF